MTFFAGGFVFGFEPETTREPVAFLAVSGFFVKKSVTDACEVSFFAFAGLAGSLSLPSSRSSEL